MEESCEACPAPSWSGDTMKRLSRLLVPFAYMGVIHLLSSIPDTEAPQSLGEKLLRWATPELQNLLHIPLFGGLAAAWYWALRPLFRHRNRTLFLCFLIPAGYAFFDEWYQLQVPGRYGSLTDAALDLTGIAATLAYVQLGSANANQT